MKTNKIQTNTVDTKYEYNDYGKLIHEVTTETVEIPDEPAKVYEANACVCECPNESDLEAEYEVEIDEPISLLKVLASISCFASIIASGCVIFKSLKKGRLA